MKHLKFNNAILVFWYTVLFFYIIIIFPKTKIWVQKTNIQIKAYNTEQFAIIDTLYLRLGFTVLIEWGHSIYLTNDGKVKDTTAADTLSSNFLNGVYKNQEQVYKAINDKKIALQGNYDATYGKVTNFSWSFEQDGTYNITLKIVSLGDVIESLKINTIAKGKGGTTPTETEKAEDTVIDLANYAILCACLIEEIKPLPFDYYYTLSCKAQDDLKNLSYHCVFQAMFWKNNDHEVDLSNLEKARAIEANSLNCTCCGFPVCSSVSA